jgi:hypothetical protein
VRFFVRRFIWLVYDIACNAVNANIDGGITSFVVGAGTFFTPSNPTGFVQ